MIPFIDLKAQYAIIEDDVRARMDAVLAHGRFIMGPEIKELEAQLAEFTGVKHALGCGSGTDALLMALMAYNVGPGDVILTSPFTFIATAEVISLLGATPAFVDIEPDTFNIDPNKLDKAVQAVKAGDPAIHPIPTSLHGNGVTPRGIIGVDIFGLPADYDRIQDIADRENMFVVGDAAQSFGGEWKGRKAGSLGNVGCTSFFPAKPLGCFGDGGAVFTDDTELAGIMESIRVHGKGTDKYDNVRVGLNARLDTLQAAVLLSKLAIFPKELDLRDEVADRYDELLAPLAPKITTPARVAATRSAWAQYSLLAESGDMRAACQAALKDAGAPTAIYYPKPLHLQTAFKYLGYEPGHMEVSEDAATRIFSLPMHPYLKAEQAEMVAKALAQAVA